MRLAPLALALAMGCSSTRSTPPDAPPGASTTPESTPTVALSASAVAPAPPASASAPTNVKTLFVDAKKVPCEGEGVTECLRVKDGPDAPWQLFYRSIEGFTYEPGYVYELRVEVADVKRAPADASSKRTKLVTVVSKRKP
jgi:hypothetical protein